MISILSLIVVGLILLFWFWKLFSFVVLRPIKIKRLADIGGTYKDGTITSSNAEIGSSNKPKKTRIDVSFTNFSGTEISHQFKFTDTQPLLNRYITGNRISLILTANPNNPVKLEGGKLNINYFVRFIHFLLLGAYCYGVAVLTNMVWTHAGENIEGLSSMTSPVAFLVPLLGGIYFFVLLLIYVVFKATGLISGTKKKNADYQLKFYGEKVSATIESVQTTGTKINDNPVILYKYSFTTKNGVTMNGQDKMLAGPLELGNVSSIPQRDILYLPDNPDVNRLEESMNKPILGGCTKYIFLFLAFVFSCVVLGIFIGNTFF